MAVPQVPSADIPQNSQAEETLTKLSCMTSANPVLQTEIRSGCNCPRHSYFKTHVAITTIEIMYYRSIQKGISFLKLMLL